MNKTKSLEKTKKETKTVGSQKNLKSNGEKSTEKKETNLQRIKRLNPYGWKRYESIAKFVWYINNRAIDNISSLCHRSGVHKGMWSRIENAFLNSYGLNKYKDAIYVQEEIGYDEKLKVPIRAGLSELTEDYLNMVLSITKEEGRTSFKEDEKGIEKFCKKYEKIARDLQKQYNSKAPVGDEYDPLGMLRAYGTEE